MFTAHHPCLYSNKQENFTNLSVKHPYRLEKLMLSKIRGWIGNGNASLEVGQQAPDFYDKVYASSDEYQKPFWQSRYYYIWTVIIDRLRNAEAKRILEIGCGPGQFAELLHHELSVSYIGLDISTEAIGQAQTKKLGNFRFEAGDALSSPLLDGDYDSLICTEVLEHIEQDYELVKRIQPNVRCLCTVPNFPYVSHVRHFENEEQVRQRYGDLFHSFSVWGITGSRREGTIYFLFDGIRKA